MAGEMARTDVRSDPGSEYNSVAYTKNMLLSLFGRPEMEPTEDNPVYAEVDIFDVHQDVAAAVLEHAAPCFHATAAITRVDNVFVWMDLLEVDSSRFETVLIPPEKYSRIVVPIGTVDISVLDTTERLTSAYRTMRRVRQGGSYVINARLFEGAGFGMAAAVMVGSEETWDLEDATLSNHLPVTTVESAMQWLLENHPDYYMGAVIEGKVEGKQGRVIPAPARAPEISGGPGKKGYRYAYQVGSFEDQPKRRQLIRQEARVKGVTLGAREYEDVWQRLAEMNDASEEDDEF